MIYTPLSIDYHWWSMAFASAPLRAPNHGWPQPPPGCILASMTAAKALASIRKELRAHERGRRSDVTVRRIASIMEEIETVADADPDPDSLSDPKLAGADPDSLSDPNSVASLKAKSQARAEVIKARAMLRASLNARKGRNS